ncbi:hypothetical protein SCUCBS95973_001198 [Sporothrix curviconia]|uniref:NADP-dependent oxidoreductase domain-containing protein n=1 Tax=Sporothrix curviconia TaxID=1260050 RepID=A0ABP0AWQ2_9PEZI
MLRGALRRATTAVHRPSTFFQPAISTAIRTVATTRSAQFSLNTGATIPALGFGTFQDADAQEDAVARCLQAGFRMIDTAQVYQVEEAVGRGIQKSGVPREDVFLATKLWCNTFHPDDVAASLDNSLRTLDTPYVDLLLMHYPVVFQRGAEPFPRDANGRMILGTTTFVDTWRAMSSLLQTGKVRAIGVSNFSQGEIQTLIDETDVVPAVHQMEVHPYLQQRAFNTWLRGHGIHVVQFSPLGNMNPFYRKTGWSKDIAHTTPPLTENALLLDIGRKHGKTPVQVALAWGMNSGRSVIPKSVVDWQIEQNLAAAEIALDAEDMERISTLDQRLRFNDPSADYEYRLYSDLEGIEGTKDGKTH